MQQAGDLDRAKDCWEKAATGHKAQRSNWHAAKALEKAADMAGEAAQYSDVESLYYRSAELYLEEGRPESAAEAVSRAAGLLSQVNPNAASGLYAKAIEWLEDSGKDSMYGEMYRQAISHALRNKKWAEAVSLLFKLATSAYGAHAMATMSKAYLGAIVVWLYAEDGSNAWQSYQDALCVDEFSSSDQAFAAEALIQAYRSISTESIDAVISSHSCFRHLDNSIARLAKLLPKTDIAKTAQSMGAVIGESTGIASAGREDLDEDDLT